MPLIYRLKIYNLLNLGNNLIYKLDLGWNEYIIGKNFVLLINQFFKFDFYFKKNFLLIIFIRYFILIIIIL